MRVVALLRISLGFGNLVVWFVRSRLLAEFGCFGFVVCCFCNFRMFWWLLLRKLVGGIAAFREFVLGFNLGFWCFFGFDLAFVCEFELCLDGYFI